VQLVETPAPPAAMAPATPDSRPSPSSFEGERKQVTVLFADLKGSMELLAGRDPEEARRVLDPVLERMIAAVRHYGGTVNQVMGDGIMALFGAPVAQEDHAVRACFAALRMRDAITELSVENERGGLPAVALRIGLNSGEVVVRAIGSDVDFDYTAVGQTTHLAARMEQMATPGTIMATAGTVTLAAAHVEVIARGPAAVKGLDAPVEVFEIARAGARRVRRLAAAARGLGRLVGREPDLARVRAAWERARGGKGRVVAIVGDAGLGKSRLVDELLRGVAEGAAVVLASDRASYDQLASWGAVTDLLREAFGALHGDDAAVVSGAIRERLVALGPSLEDAYPALAGLLEVLPADDPFLALEPAVRRQRMREAVSRFLLATSRATPLIVVVENLQWVDSESRAFLDELVQAVARERLLLVVTHRAEPDPGWRRHPHVDVLRLEPLTEAHADELLGALLGDDEGVKHVRRLLVERSEGNPFFLEESVRALVETGALLGEPGAYRLARPLDSVALPATVQALLASRIDRLAPGDKQLLQTAAVIGPEVPLAVLRTVVDVAEDELSGGLARLAAAGFIQAVRLHPHIEYGFVQALTHEVAYRSLLAARRRGLHARIAEALEASGAAAGSEDVERLAHHAFHGELWERAVRHSTAAGTRAATRAANAEAVAFLEQALAALGRLPESAETRREAIDLRIALRPPLLQLGRLDDVLARSEEAEHLAEALGDSERLARVYTYLINYHFLRGDPERALTYGERCRAIARERDDGQLAVVAERYLGQIHHVLGQYARAREVLSATSERLASKLAPPGGHTLPVVSDTGAAAPASAPPGASETASGETAATTSAASAPSGPVAAVASDRAPAPDGQAAADARPSPGAPGDAEPAAAPSVTEPVVVAAMPAPSGGARASAGAHSAVDFVSCSGWLAFTLTELGEFEAAREWTERAHAAAEASGQPYAQAIAGTFQGLTRLRHGEAAHAADLLARALALCHQRGLTVWQPIPSSLLGVTLARLGQKEEALPFLRAGVHLTERLGVRAYLALWMQHLGEGLLARGDGVAARETATRALELARAHREQGHEAGALRLLGDIALNVDARHPAEAGEHFSRALDLAVTLGMRPLQAQCQLALSRIALRVGDRRTAVARLTDALALFGEMEMLSPLREAREELKPVARMFIVARQKAELYAFLQRYVDDASVAVIMDRREGERRHHRGRPGEERRRGDRRRRAEIDASLQARGLAIVS
jgi:class 3 adenylate cyclase/tetratricopeptide (TPR) repeat protein